MKYKYGRLVLEVPLPSRKEKCLFFLQPMLMSIGDLVADMQREDPGVTASVFSQGESGLMTFLTPIKRLCGDLVQQGCGRRRAAACLHDTLVQLSLIQECKKKKYQYLERT